MKIHMKSTPIQLNLHEHDAKKKTKTWFATFKGRNAEVLSYRASKKKNWFEYSLHRGEYEENGDIKHVSPHVCKGDLPEQYENSYRKMKMRAVRVQRRMHGQGTFVYEAGDVYKGGWNLGHAHGEGKSYQEFGNYEGGHVKGHKEGHGHMQFCNGDSYTGEMGHKTMHEPARIEGREYSFGLPHGAGAYTFTDGSKYEGQFLRGAITGQGKYTGSDGEVKEGEFLDGELHGRGRHITMQGAKTEGNFVQGRLTGFGSFVDPRRNSTTDKYTGEWLRGHFHGLGQFTFMNGDNYYG